MKKQPRQIAYARVKSLILGQNLLVLYNTTLCSQKVKNFI